MKILLVCATPLELDPIQQMLNSGQEKHEISLLISGVGMIETTHSLTKELSTNKYDLAINFGVAGAFDRTLSLGEVVEIIQDQFSEELIEDGDEYMTYEQVGLREADKSPFKNGRLCSTFSIPQSTLTKTSGITVNTVHGNGLSIKSIVERLNPQVESMEGAAFFYVCNQMEVPCLQLRAISNYVEKRNRSSWEIELALNNLVEAISSILMRIE